MPQNDSKRLKCLKRLNIIKILGLKAKERGKKSFSPPKKSKIKKNFRTFLMNKNTSKWLKKLEMPKNGQISLIF